MGKDEAEKENLIYTLFLYIVYTNYIYVRENR